MFTSSTAGASPDTVRRHNRALILRHIFAAGPTSRTRLAECTGLTTASITRITRELIDEGLLCEGSPLVQEGRRGRRFISLQFAPDSIYVLGLGIGAYEQWLTLSGCDGNPVSRLKLDLLGAGTPERAITLAIREARGLIRKAAIDPARIAGFGAAVAGITDPSEGTVVRSSNIGWENVPLGRRLGRTLGLPVRVESLHHALNMAEAGLGQTRGCRNVLLVNAALGIGASILADGRLINGSTGAAGQMGHMPVVGAGEVCTCGRTGCLDTVASGHAVLRALQLVGQRVHAREHGVRSARQLEGAMERALAGDRESMSAFGEAGRRLGEAIAAVVAVSDPEAIVLAGPLSHVPAYVEGVRQTLAVCLERRPDIRLILSGLSSDRAAAWLAIDDFVLSQGMMQVQGPTGIARAVA